MLHCNGRLIKSCRLHSVECRNKNTQRTIQTSTHWEKNRPLWERIVQAVIVYIVQAYTAAYAYLVLMPTTLLLVYVKSVNSNHIGSYVCLLAMTLSNTANITVNHGLISWNATFCCCQMCWLGLGFAPECCQRGGGPGLCWQPVPCPRCSHMNARSPRVAGRVDGTSSVGLSTERRRSRATTSDVGRRLSARHVDAVPCTQWYARTHNRNWMRSGQCSVRFESQWFEITIWSQIFELWFWFQVIF